MLGCAGTAAGLSWSWSAVDAGCLVAQETRVDQRRPVEVTEEFLRLALRRAV